MSVEPPSDEDLARRTAEGDEAAFAALYRRRQGDVYRFALEMSGSAALAEDVTQDVFLTLIDEAGKYDAARGSVAAFLYGIARNHVRRRLKRMRRYAAEAGCEPEAAGDPHSDLARAQEIAAVRAAVLSLPVRYREVVVLCDLNEMDYERAAAALGCAVGTVRSRLHRARRLLAAKLEPSAGRAPERCWI